MASASSVNTPKVPKWKKSKEKIQIHKIFNGFESKNQIW